MSNQQLKSSAQKIDISDMFEALAMRFPVCMASDEFHFFPQVRAREFDWSLWDDFSHEALVETVTQLKNWERQLDIYAKQSLSIDRQIDSAMTGRVLRTLREQFELVRAHEIQPTFYLTMIGIGLAEALEAGHHAVQKRANSLPQFVDRVIRNLIEIPRLFLALGMEMLAEQQKWMGSLSLPENTSALILNSLRRLGDHLKRAKVTDEFLPTVELYERIATDHMGCDMKPDDIARELDEEIKETQSILTRSATVMASGRPWQAVVGGLPRPTFPPGGVLKIYRDAVDELGRHCLSNGMIPEELVRKCPVRVEPIPDYMRPVRSNAAYSMPPVHPPRGGTFFIQEPEGAGTVPADYRLLAAHETFPGHHLLDTFRWLQERPARRHIEFPIFYEGWASFAEELMFETGLFSGPADRMLMAKRRFWRAVRGKVDFDIHMRHRTLDQAAAYMAAQGMKPCRAGVMVRRYVLKPGYQLAYTIGRRRFRALYTSAHPKEKGPAAFARSILALGEIGLDQLEKLFRQGG